MKCPHCLVTVHFQGRSTSLGEDVDGFWLIKYPTCPNCRRLVIYIRRSSRDISPHQPAPTSKTTPSSPSLEILAFPRSIQRDPPPVQVPEEFTKDYLEAALIINDSPKASAAISRRLLQHLLREKAQANQRNLVDAIQHVIDEGSIPSHISESLHTLREIGNFAAHPTKSTNTAEVIEVEPGEAEWCLDVIDALYDHYFVVPDKARQAKEAINAKRKEAGFQPIK